MKLEVKKGKIRFSSRLGWFEFWWFPEDQFRPNQGKGKWQIMGHMFCNKPFNNFWLEHTWHFGRNCGYGITSPLLCLRFIWEWKAWSPLLNFTVGSKQ